MALALSACGGSKPAGKSVAVKVPPAQSQAQIAEDRKLGERALLGLSDFPTGWTEKPVEKSPEVSKHLLEGIAKCLRVNLALLGIENHAQVESPEFVGIGEETVEDSVTVEANAGTAREWLAIFQQQRTAGCISKGITAVLDEQVEKGKLPQGLSIGEPSVARESFPPVGSQSVALQVSIPIKDHGTDITEYLDLVALRAGRSVSGLSFSQPESPVEAALEEQTARVAAQRLASIEAS